MKKIIQAFGLMALLVSQSGLAQEQLTSRLWVDLDDKGKLSVNSNYLTYHAARVTYGQNKTVSDLMLVTPAQQVISLPKWGDTAVFDEGSVFPKWSWIKNGGYLETGDKNGSLSKDLPLFIGTGWNNSTVDLYGSSIYSWFGDKDTDNSDAFIMLGLNAMHGVSIASETLASIGETYPDAKEVAEIAKNIQTAQARLKDVKKWVDFFKTYGKFAEETTIFIVEFRKSASNSLSEDDLVWLSELENRIHNINIVIDQVSSALKINKADLGLNNQEKIEMETVFRQAILNSIVDQQPPPTEHSEALSFLAKKLAVEYDKAKYGGERTLILQTKIYDLLGSATSIYEKKLITQLKTLKSNKENYNFDEYQTQYRTLKTRADLIKLGVYALEASKILLASEVSECSSNWTDKCQENFFRAIVGFGSIIVSDLFDPEVGTLRLSRLAPKFENWFTSTSFADIIKSGLKRTKMVTNIGNKAIPFVWDFIGAPDGFAIDITNGQLSRTGVATHKFNVVIKNTATGQVVRTVGIDPSVANKEIKIPINVGETWTATYGIEQPKLFMYDRAPWETISTPQKAAYELAYEVNVGGQIKYHKDVLCVRNKILAVGNSAAFSVQKEWGNGRIPAGMISPPDASGQSTCGVGLNPVNSPWFDNFTAQDIVLPTGVTNRFGSYFSNKDALSPRDRFDTGAEPIFEVSRAFTAESGNESIKFTAFIPDSYPENIEKTISFVPVIPSITASTSTPAINTPMTVVLNGIESIVSYIKEIIWTFGQDVVHTIADFTSAVQNIFQTTGEQVITAKVYDTNGNQLGSHTSITVNVVDTSPIASLIGTPTTLTVGQPVDIVISNSKAQSGYLCRYEISFNENSTMVSPPASTTTPPVALPTHVPPTHIVGSGRGCATGNNSVPLSPYNVTFEYAGNFTITLTVTDNQGKTATVTQAIVVNPSTNIDWKLNPETGHLYTAVNCGTWTQCEAKAVELGGHLVTVNDEAEQNWIVANFGLQTSFWIGMNDAKTEGVWVWSSGESVGYTNWAVGEPNDGLGLIPEGNDYAQIWGNQYINLYPNANDPTKWMDNSNTGQGNVTVGYGIIEKSPDGTFLVNANDPIGTAFTVPSGATSCSFNTTGSWRYGNASSQSVDALGDPSQAGMWPDYPRIYSEAPYFSLIAQAQGSYVSMGVSKTLAVVDGQNMNFMINEGINNNANSYADNSGVLTVSYHCNGTEIMLPAIAFLRGEHVAITEFFKGGALVDALLNAPPYTPVPINAAEWDFYAPKSGQYELFAEYAALQSRPVVIAFNGNITFPTALAQTTGGWYPANRQIISQGIVQLSAGATTMRVSRVSGDVVFPHIKGFKLVPLN